MYSFDVDANQIYVSGNKIENLQLDGFQAPNKTNSNYVYGFVVKINQDGRFVWFTPTTDLDKGRGSIANHIKAKDGIVYYNGNIGGKVYFNGEEFTSQGAGQSAFIAQLKDLSYEPLSRNENAKSTKELPSFSVFPSPNQGQVNLRFDGVKDGDYPLSILDYKGASVHEEKISISNNRAALSHNLTGGLHLAQLIVDGTSLVHRLVINE